MKYYCSDKCLNKNYLTQIKNENINNNKEKKDEDSEIENEYDPMYDF